MNQPVYLAGRGLACGLGPDLPGAVRRLAQGGVRPGHFELPRVAREVQGDGLGDGLGDGQGWPYHAIADIPPDTSVGTDRAARERRLARQVVAESGALDGPRNGPLFVASSSMDMSTREDHPSEDGDFQDYAEHLAEAIGWRGPVFTVATACTSALNALLSAHALLRHGRAAQALVLGIELRNRVTLGGFGGMQLLSSQRALPLGQHRAGLVLGEAVAALHLSTTPARWRVAGGANVVDGRDPAGLVPGAVVAMCQQALAACGLRPGDIHLLKPQAAGGVAGDAAEVAALQQVFGTTLPPLVSLKAALGHTLGAAGAAEIALLTASLEAGAWPAIDYPQDPSIPARLAEQAPARVRHLLASILGFGGGHAAVVLEDTLA